MTGSTCARQVYLLVPRHLVKKVKSALESCNKLDKSERIKPGSNNSNASHPVSSAGFLVPVADANIADEEGDPNVENALQVLLASIGLLDNKADLKLVVPDREISKPAFDDGRLNACSSGNGYGNPLSQIVHAWLSEQLVSISQVSEERRVALAQLIEKCTISRWTYTIYPPLLLLPSNSFSSWPLTLRAEAFVSGESSLAHQLCQAFQVTHIALNAPIPETLDGPAISTNILRSPSGLVPMHGDFGPALPPGNVHNSEDFAEAFWCTAKQNGIFQSWAPRYSMFSRGNISEKARILSLDSLTESRLGCKPDKTTAVDLYAGIGYFSFSYAKAGVGKVLCWEINPWSIEGLRRGAFGNKWKAETVCDDERSETSIEKVQNDVQLIVFQENNEKAKMRIHNLRKEIPPIRHVSCGFLPSSKDSWKIAVEALDPHWGGWIHAHENIAKKDIASRTSKIVGIFKYFAMQKEDWSKNAAPTVECEHVERVKSYAPGVIHCVLDISITTFRQPS